METKQRCYALTLIFIFEAEFYDLYVPFLSMSLITLVSGVLTLMFLSKTRMIELPETLNDTLHLKT